MIKMLNFRYLISAVRHFPLLRGMSTQGNYLDISVDGEGIALMSLKRLPVNSINTELLQAVNKKLEDLQSNECKGLVITSRLPRIFSAGLDLNELNYPDPKKLREFWWTLQETALKLYGSPFTTTVAINGFAAAAGACFISVLCDYRVMVNDGKAKIGINDTAVGVVPRPWICEIINRVMGSRHAEIALTASTMYTAEEAMKGFAAAAGACFISVLCDYRVMVNDGKAKIGINDTAVGVVPRPWICEIINRVMGSRHAEIALTASTMYTAEEAMKVNLIDETALDKEDAIEKCKQFIRRFDNIPQKVAAETKKKLRTGVLNYIENNREKDIELFAEGLMKPCAQTQISMLVQQLKQKKKY